MNMRMTADEVREAIREWLGRRGVTVPDNEIQFSYLVRPGVISDSGTLITDILSVELPPKDGPYR